MGGAARSHGGTRGHGWTPLVGERPNLHFHTLSDTSLSRMVKSKRKNTSANPSDGKVIIVNKLQTANSAKCVYVKVQNKEKHYDEEKAFYSTKAQQSMFEKKAIENVISQATIHKAADKKKIKVEDVKAMDRMTRKQAESEENHKMESRANEKVKPHDKEPNEVIDFGETKQDMEKYTMVQNEEKRGVGKVTENMIDKKEVEQTPENKEKEDLNNNNARNKEINDKSIQKSQDEQSKYQLLHVGKRREVMGKMIDENGKEQMSGKKVRERTLDEKTEKKVLGEKTGKKILDEKTREQMTYVKERLIDKKPLQNVVEDQMLDQSKRLDNNQVCQPQNQRNCQQFDQQPTDVLVHNAYHTFPQQKQILSAGQFVIFPVLQQCARQGASPQHQMMTMPPVMHPYQSADWSVLPSFHLLSAQKISSQHQHSSGDWKLSSHTDD